MLHGLCVVGELQQGEVGPRYHHVFSLAALPATEVESICCAWEIRVGVLADFCVPLSAIPTAPTGDIERDGDDVTFLDKLHVAAHLDDLGVGFYGYARRAGLLLPGMDKDQFLIEQEKKVREALREK